MANYELTWHEWYTEEIAKTLRDELWPIREMLIRNGIAKLVIRKWLREAVGTSHVIEIVNEKEIKEIENNWYQERGINVGEGDRNKKEDILMKYSMNEFLINSYCKNEYFSLKWAEDKWSQSLRQQFLEKKEMFDYSRVVYVTADEKEKHLMSEVYFAVKNGEYNLEDAIVKYPEKLKGTSKSVKIRIGDMKPAMRYHIIGAQIGKITAPFKSESKLVVVKVEEYISNALNKEIEEEIIKDNLNEFITFGVNKILNEWSTQGDDSVE
jgi:hypothetical protein